MGGSFQTSAHGVAMRQTPQVGSIKPGGFFDHKALDCGVRIEDGHVFVAGTRQASWDSVIASQASFIDFREQQNTHKTGITTVTDINVQALQQQITSQASLFHYAGCGSFNGVVYATRAGATPTNLEGIRLRNGEAFSQKISFISNTPVYILGNFNCGSADCSSGTRQSVSVIGDAVTILSSNWKDSYAANSGPSSRQAVDTTVNAAVVAGIVPSGDCGNTSCYSGGFENYPRFLEDWTPKVNGETLKRRLKMRGAFAQLWNSEIANTPWKGDNAYYDAPLRDWRFDDNFLVLEQLPVEPPSTIQAVRVLWNEQ